MLLTDWFFALTALLALLGLAYVATDTVPRIIGTTAFIVTLAAIASTITGGTPWT